jgi:hypothetical protein
MIEVAQSDEASALLKFQIKTFTGRYIPVEDRLRLDAVDEEGNKQLLFMTRRLTDKVIPVMIEHLEGQTPEGMPSDLVQEMQQDLARQVRAEGGYEAPVYIEPELIPWLCRTAHLTKTGTSLVVVFTDDTHIEAHMSMSAENLRVVLDIFKTLYTSAEWGLQAFPDWMQAVAAKGLPRQLN